MLSAPGERPSDDSEPASSSPDRRSSGAGAAIGQNAARAPDAPTARWSLEFRLPMLILALLALVMGGFSAAAYREVRSATISRSGDRLERLARELSATYARAATARTDALHGIAADSTVIRALLDSSAAPAIPARLAATGRRDATLLGVQLTTLAGESRFRSVKQWSPRDSAALSVATAAAARTSSDERSPLYGVDSSVHIWTVVPVKTDGRVIGTLAELRRIGGSARTESVLRELIGDDVRVLYTSAGSTEWASPGGKLVPAPFTLPATENETVLVKATAGDRYFTVHAAVPRTPWRVVLLAPEASVLRRPQDFLRSMLGVGLLLLALATAAAWLLGRHVTRPLRDVTRAAAGLAAGDYSQRVSGHQGGRELASLATTFNVMASGIGDAHAALAERNVQLQRANSAKAQFLAMMSHELRTPLNAIGGFTELMELGLRGPVTPEQVEDLVRIRRNKDHLLSIITDILDFTRADAGALNLTLAPVPLATLLADVVDMLGPRMVAKGVRLQLDPIPADAVARGDREKLQQVVLNLLSNALKFTSSGGEVAISTEVAGDSVGVSVRDTGTGIPAEQLNDIFEPFIQVDASLTRRAGGTGLGLAIARHLVVAMGGTLTVTSTVGEGSTFCMTLPHAARSTTKVAQVGPIRPVARQTT